ncbi:MAG: hypothetical protein HY698_01865 [Deltaproteobacteria bacterium]|nr:hypothetical protein [Deltaproteobacteria bacterium]
MRARVLAALGLVLVYLYAFPYFAALKSASELPRIFLTQEIVDKGTFRIDRRIPEMGSTFDVSTTPDGHKYSNKAPGMSFMAVPVHVLLKGAHGLLGDRPSLREVTWAFRALAVTIPCLLFLPVFVRVVRRFAPHPAPQRATLVAYALGSMALPYAIFFISHSVAAAAAGGAFACAVLLVRGEVRRPKVAAMSCGFLAGMSVLVDYQSVLAASAVGVFLLVRSRKRLADATWALLGTLPPAAALLLYHQACFGSPWKTGYSFAADPLHKHGFLGIIGPNRAAFAQALVDPDNGLLLLMPWTLLSIVGAVAILRSREARARVGAEAVTCIVVVLAYLLFIGSLEPEFGRGGWGVGPRYIGVALPFLAWLCAAGLQAADGHVGWRVLGHGAVLVGAIIYVATATTYPHWPTSFKNPLFEVTFRMLGEGLAPYSLATLFGASGFLSLLPVYLVAAGLAVGLLSWRERKRLATTAAAALVTAVYLFAYSQFPRTGEAGERPWQFIRATWEPR